MAHSFDRLKELNLSRDEVNRIGEALKKEEFRKLLADYVEEIQDPKNRQLYEDEVCQIERERGQEVTFLHPTPGYVIKTSINGSQKGFINICSNSNINKPSSTPTTKEGARGLQWSLPHSLSLPHEDLDNKGVRCQVFDVLFHPDALHLAYKNAGFRSLLNHTAVEAVESNFNVELDKKNLKFPKLSYKGMKRASIMRTPSKTQPLEKSPEEQDMYNKIFADIEAQRSANSFKSSSPKKVRSRRNSNGDVPSHTTPKYVIKHRSHIDIQEFRESKDAKINAAIPKELIVEVDLPLLKSSSDMNLDVTEKTVQVISEKPAKYKLNLTLPYQVNELNGNAKFDKDLRKLIITLPVKQRVTVQSLKFDDSGVESSVDSDTHSPTSPESDDDSIQEHENVIIKPSEKLVNPVRTNDFLDASDLYILPEYKCNIFDNSVVFTFNVKNVDEKTVQKRLCASESIVKVKFTSMSPSFYPSCYSFYVKLPSHKFIEDSVTVETWDNYVILQIPLIANETQFYSYYCGLNQDSLSEKFMEKPVTIKSFEKTEPVKESKEPIKAIDNKHDQGIEEANNNNNAMNHSKAIDIIGSSYESSGDELSASSFSPRKSKGILKRMSANRSKFGRSISESSLDDIVCSSYENYHGSIECVPEDDREQEEDMSSSLKKTVRFNDVIMKQLFRSNSSILGQKKKNQRKARNKKRAQERRYSESEASDVDSKKEGENQTNINPERPVKIVSSGPADEKKDDGAIFHLEINN